MLTTIGNEISSKWLLFFGVCFSFITTTVALRYVSTFLPRDLGREFAHDGKKSAGKPRGAGLLFVLTFALSALLFGAAKTEILIYLMLIVTAMITGYLDDASKNPWGEYKKGFLDFLIALAIAITYLSYQSNQIHLSLLQMDLTIPYPVFGALIVVLVWVSINVTNCTDGVDGLSGSLTVTSLFGLFLFEKITGAGNDFSVLSMFFMGALLSYLWFNATPSLLMMGDAGSRAMGLVIAIAFLKSGSPLLYIPFVLVMILDGGLGLVKVFLLRFFKIRILTKVRTPLHDQVRKNMGWSNTQTVFRFVIIQIVLIGFVLLLL